MSAVASTLLAHQGGWDEVLLIAGPIVVIAGLLMLAKRRVDSVGEPNGDESTAKHTTDADRPSR